jgi:hypothetical protein
LCLSISFLFIGPDLSEIMLFIKQFEANILDLY